MDLTHTKPAPTNATERTRGLYPCPHTLNHLQSATDTHNTHREPENTGQSHNTEPQPQHREHLQQRENRRTESESENNRKTGERERTESERAYDDRPVEPSPRARAE